MRRLACLTVLAAAALTAPAAHASAVIYPPKPTLPPGLIMCGMCPDYLVEQWLDKLAASIHVQQDMPEGATAKRSAVAAYGTGTTSCTINATRTGSSFEGTTDCSGAVLQTAQATMTGPSPAVTGPLCTGLRASCRSAGSGSGAYTDVSYRITLVAPLGQGWIASPKECSGAGTDRLECRF